MAAKNLPDEMLEDIVKARAATAKVGWNPLLHDPRLESLLHRVTARTLCLWGSHDKIVPPVYGETFARRIPNAELRIVDQCGHLIPLEKLDAFVDAVRGFVE
jgi:pimeloyl-ACP methyl ester carboxylesterase